MRHVRLPAVRAALVERVRVSAEGVELLARVAKGDREAFGRFYDAYAPLAFGVIRRILPQPGDAEDVLQEVFWEIWRLAPRYDPARGAPAAWVLTRARSRAIDRLRSLRRRDEVGVEAIDTASATDADGHPRTTRRRSSPTASWSAARWGRWCRRSARWSSSRSSAE